MFSHASVPQDGDGDEEEEDLVVSHAYIIAIHNVFTLVLNYVYIDTQQRSRSLCDCKPGCFWPLLIFF